MILVSSLRVWLSSSIYLLLLVSSKKGTKKYSKTAKFNSKTFYDTSFNHYKSLILGF